MSFGKVARKLKRVGKNAVQFRFTSTFEYVDLSFNGTWRPDTLRVVWLRNHRKVKSTDVKWVATEDRGPNGADGRASFDPIISVALIVTLYRDTGQMEFQEKEYKYYIENDGPSGKKILASFNCDMAEYAVIPSSEHTLDMSFKAVSQKVSRAVLGITLKSEFMKQGTAVDDDMQSTFSAMSAGTDASYDDDDDDEEDGDRKHGAKVTPRLSIVEEGSQEGAGGPRFEDSLKSVLVLGTGETLKRNTLPIRAPPKPTRSGSFKDTSSLIRLEESSTGDDVGGTSAQNVTSDQTTPPEHKDIPGKPPSKDQPGEPPSKDQPGEPPSKDQPGEPPSKDQSGEPPSKDQPGEPPSKDQPGEPPSKDQSGDPPSKDQPGEPPSKDQPGEPPSKDQPASTGNLDTDVHVPKDSKGGNAKRDEGTVEATRNDPANKPPETAPVEKECSSSDQKSKTNSQTDKTPDTNSQHAANGCTKDPIANGHSDKEGLIESTEPKPKPAPEPDDHESGRGGYDYVFEASRSLARITQARESRSESTTRKSVESQEEYRPPPNPYLQDDNEEFKEETPEPPSPTAKWLGEDTMFVDCFGEGVGREKLDRAELIALYFSASWCPPCRRFLPKLIKFYHHLKQHGKSFEILYISSDYSKQEMMKYMQQQQMPWVGLAFEGKASQNIQKDFEVSAIPQLKVVSTKGTKIEENGKKQVEVANSGADVLKLYNKWHERLEAEERGLSESGSSQEHKEKKGLFQKVKNVIRGKEEVPIVEKKHTDPEVQLLTTNGALSRAKSREDVSGTRQVVEGRSRGRSNVSLSGKSKLAAEALLEEKDERVRYLEEVNMTLKQTNDELNEEVAELKRQLTDLQTKMSDLEQTSKQLEDDKRETVAKLSTRGWLYKRGVRGLTANVWRRRYFRCDQGTKVCYYKSAAEGTPQGFIDLEKVISVQEVSPAQQDKNNATFLVQCDGRTYQLQAHDESAMRKWMSAIEYLKNWHKRNSLQDGATP